MSVESKRTYRKRHRAESEAGTRLRITEAAVRLHGSVGPARTTISAVAQEAGVQRATVYRHFPDEVALFEACSGHFWSQHPPPDISRWSAIRDPDERLATALEEIYGWYAEVEEMLDRTGRDAHLVPAMAAPAAAFRAALETMRELLLRGRPERGRARRRRTAAIGHALAFPTWRSLVREQGLEPAEAAALMAAFAAAA
jgi:AcrR family transcriptional regulator